MILNISHEEYMALTKEERIKLNDKLKWMTLHDFEERYPDKVPKKYPCVIDGILIIG